MILTERLKTVAQLVPHTGVLADIGTDHGYIPVYCVKNGICSKAIAMDINEMPLEKSKQNIIKYDVQQKIETRLSNGMQKLFPGEADCIVIAGMGGLLIRDILQNGKNRLKKDTFLVLQPMIAVRELRQYLYTNGFCIENEYVCREQNKFYNILTVKMGNASFNEYDVTVGHNLLKNSSDTFYDYIKYKIQITQKIINGLKLANNIKQTELDFYENELRIFMNAKGGA